MSRTLAAVLFGLLAFAHPAVLANDTFYLFNSGADANAAPIWLGTYEGKRVIPNPTQAPIWALVPLTGNLGVATSVEGVMSAAEKKVIEMSADWLADVEGVMAAYPALWTSNCTAPVRELTCDKLAPTQKYEPGTTNIIDVNLYNCVGRWHATCKLYILGSLAVDATSNQIGRIDGIIKDWPPGLPAGGFHAHGIYTRACSIKDVPLFGPSDPPALDMTNITPRTRQAADCLLGGLGIVNLGGAGDAAVFESGYRTLEYQKHFRELWDKKKELDEKKDPRCTELRAKITDHFNSHGLGGTKENPIEVAPTVDDPACLQLGTCNCHTAGTCFDVKSVYIPSVDQNGFACKVRRPYPGPLNPKDPVHVVPY